MVNLRFWSALKDGRPRNTLGSYELVCEIGKGSMGVVYRGRDRLSGREVAIKTVSLAKHVNAAALEDVRARFIQEATILNWLDHPDIVTIHDVGEEHGMTYIVMELLKGVELDEHAKPGNLLPLDQTLEIVARVADALSHAHCQNVTHRDVKPANIMFDASSNAVKVMDFGISRLTNFSLTRLGIVLGSPRYMSPEQVRGEPLDGLSDLFSLGTTCYQLLCGRLPFTGKTEYEVMRSIAERLPIDLLSVRPDLPPGVVAIVYRALSKNAKDRFQSGAEMAEAIRNCAAALQERG